MNPVTYPCTPNKRKLSEKRDDDVVITPSLIEDDECDDSPRDTNDFVSTPCMSFESPMKRRRTAIDVARKSQLSPPPMPRIRYRPSTLAGHQFERKGGRPILDIFVSDSNIERRQHEENLSFLEIPTPPSARNETDKDSIPIFGLSPRTTLAPRFPNLLESHPIFGFPEEEESFPRGRLLPALRMRRTYGPKRLSGRMQLIEDLSMPTLAEVTIEQSQRERRNSLPAVAA
jgi:hypothetical protein